jgi:hypothetical protein
MNLRYQNGAWGLYNGSSWAAVPGLANLSVGSWHRLRITGRNWGSAAASYDIELSAAGATNLTSSSRGLTVYHNAGTTHPTTQKARYFVFTTEFENSVGTDIDQVQASCVLGPVPPSLKLDGMTSTRQSSTEGIASSELAVDHDPSTYSLTTNSPGTFWEMELDRTVSLQTLRILPPPGSVWNGMLNGLVLKIENMAGQPVHTSTLAGAPHGDYLLVTFPSPIDARIIRIELPPGGTNGIGDHRIALAEVGLIATQPQASGPNLALNKPGYMVRLLDTLPAPGLANDGNLGNLMESTDKTVDAWWETDLGSEKPLTHVRVTGVTGPTDQYRLGRATLRLYDENHVSIHSQRLSSTSHVFDVFLPGPVEARYLRIGFENKIRSSTTNGIEWYLRIREVEAWGAEEGTVGVTSFTASASDVSPGQSVTLSWQTGGLQSLRIHPDIGSVGALTQANGSGQITLSPTQSTRYMLVGTTPTGTYFKSVSVKVGSQSLRPEISEVVASNRLSLRDGFNEAPDWIEIHNPSSEPLDLSGYGLSDDPLQPLKWTFPAGTMIPPHGNRVILASNRILSGTDSAGFLHAGFALSTAGESVVLSTPDGSEVIDSITFGPQDEDLAYGRTPDGETTFLDPTPEAANLGKSYQGWLAAPVFSVNRGVMSSAFTLDLFNPNPDSQLLYSINGDEPTLPYTGPLSISTSQSVRATVRREGYRSPRTVTHSYLFPSLVPTSPGMNASYASGTYLTRQLQGFEELPLVSITVPDLPDDYLEIAGSAEFFLPGQALPIQINCGVERFGGAWTNFAKKSYKLSFVSKYGAPKLEAPLFRGFDQGIPARERFDSLELRAGNHDMVERGCYMSGRFIEDSTLAMGSLNPHGRFAHVFINGAYWGMYDMRERLDDAFLSEYLGGAKEDYVNVRGNDNVGSAFVPGTPEPPNRDLWENVRANRSSYLAIKDKVDVPHLIDFMLIWFFGNNENEFRCAGPILPGTGFKFWLADSDGFLFSPNVSSALTVNRTDNAGPGSIFGALVTEGHPDFRMLLADRIQKHLVGNGALTSGRNLTRFNARTQEIQNAIVAECARWGYRTPENWASATESLRTGYFPQRSANLLGYLQNRGLFPSLAAPTLSQSGGTVAAGYPLSFTGTTGSVYFTLDGSDPRLPGGGVSPSAQAWNGSTQTLVPTGSSWKYWDQGSLPATDWHSPGYQDSSWPSGAAQLGYGDGDETTVVSFGTNSNNKHATTWFRRTFTVSEPSAFSQLTLNLIRDDGAVIYINGTEVARTNMPAGAITSLSTALSAIGGTSETTPVTFTIPANLLVAGNNVIAVSMHQHGTAGTINSTDLSFDLSLQASSSGVAALLQSNSLVRARVWDGANWSPLTEAQFRIAHPLATQGPYLFGDWSTQSSAGTHPPNMTFYQTSTVVADPGLAVEMENVWNLPYNRSTRSRINGLGGDGFSFINTSDPQNDPGAGYVGTAVLDLDTTGSQDIRVMWTGGTVAANVRDYGIRLQYRIGTSGGFSDVMAGGAPVEYLRNPVNGHSAIIGPVILPALADNQPHVQLRWKYYHRSGTSGSRPQLRVDDIQVSAGHPAPAGLVIIDSPLSGQTGRTLGPVIVQARSSQGALATGFGGSVQIETLPPNALSGTITRQASGGTVVFDDLSVATAGPILWRASSSGLTAGESDSLTQVLSITGLMVPLHIQGRAGTNDARVPWAARFRIEGLLPNTTYRYANRFRLSADAETSDGAGNMIFPMADGFIRSTAGVSFLSSSLHSGHGQWVSDASGKHEGWFMGEPTGNGRFASGGSIQPLILLNDGEGGETPFHRLIATEEVGVIDFGPASGQGSAIHGESTAAAKSFVVLHSNANGEGRPLAIAAVESTGALTDANYAPFYRNEVTGHPGRWGTIIPNFMESGIRRVETRSFLTGELIDSFVAEEGMIPTRNLAQGASSTGLLIPSPSSAPFTRWQARHFRLDQIASESFGGPSGQPLGDGIPNLLKFAFAMDPYSHDRQGLPVIDLTNLGGEQVTRLRFRRLTGDHGLHYRILVSENLIDWDDASSQLLPGEEIGLSPVPGSEIVTRYLTLEPEPKFLRVEVTQD